MKKTRWMLGTGMVLIFGVFQPKYTNAAEFTQEEQQRIAEITADYEGILAQDYYAPWETMFDQLPNVTSAPYGYGQMKNLYQQQSEEYINFIRSFNNLPKITISNEDVTVAQQVAAGMASINTMSHGLDNALKPTYITQNEWDLASKGTNQSNLHYSSADITLSNQPIDSWMRDAGASNKAVGHRSWILNYGMKTTGVGIAKSATGSNYAAMRVIKDSPTYASPENLIVEWPSEGVFPTNYLSNGYRWSTQFDYKNYDLSGDVKVKLTNVDTNQVWNFSRSESDGEFEITDKNVYGYYYTVMFNPSNISYKAGDKFKVELTGLKGGASSHSYTVTLFDLPEKEPLVVPLTNFEVKEKEVTIKIGETYRPEFIYTPGHATNKGYSSQLKSGGVLQTNSMMTGSVQGLSEGTDTVAYTSSDGKIKTTVKITVVDPATILPEAITITAEKAEIEVGETIQLTGAISPENSTNKAIIWISSDDSLADVSETGVVTGKKVGQLSIIAKTHNGKTALYSLTVKEKQREHQPIKELFPDPVLAERIAVQFKRTVDDFLTNEELENTTKLNFYTKAIVDIEGIQLFSNLQELNLAHTKVQNIDLLQQLSNLTSLNLSKPNYSKLEEKEKESIYDVSALTNLTKLTSLSLGGNLITDVKPLEKLTNLTNLGIDRNRINDISALKNLVNLESLTIGNAASFSGEANNSNTIEDVSVIANFSKLKSFDATGLPIRNWEAMKELTNLEYFIARNSSFSDLAVVSKLTQLQRLWIQDTAVSDLTPIIGLSKLSSLGINDCAIVDFMPLDHFTADVLGGSPIEKVELEGTVDSTGMVSVSNPIKLANFMTTTALTISDNGRSEGNDFVWENVKEGQEKLTVQADLFVPSKNLKGKVTVIIHLKK